MRPPGVIAQRCPSLTTTIKKMQQAGEPFVCLDGTLIHTSALHAKAPGKKTDLWFSGKHHRHGANIQVLADSSGFPIWVSPAEPGSTHDIVTARVHVLPALYKAAVQGLPTLADKGYTGARAGIKTLIKGSKPSTCLSHNLLQTVSQLRVSQPILIGCRLVR
ncbi:hypothetical protein AoKodu_09580 [Actinomyces oris K20]|uniref:transposase family protein n=1 Tax=Actinomyces oris TaxID=544580 RepID=UPI000200386C|nr:transposase family protein [Actinomyces oris]BDF98657.1 hypothetical protein AoKodu_09580 [Actinomyces oris K20]